LIENFVAELKEFRAIATRCDRTTQTFSGRYLAEAIWLMGDAP
jgi:hypothetical protein